MMMMMMVTKNDSTGFYFHAKSVCDFKVEVASQPLTTIMAKGCDCSVQPIINCLLLFKIIITGRINMKRKIEVVLPHD